MFHLSTCIVLKYMNSFTLMLIFKYYYRENLKFILININNLIQILKRFKCNHVILSTYFFSQNRIVIGNN